MKESMSKLDSIKIKPFCSVKNNVKKISGEAIDWEKNFFFKNILDKGLLPYICKECLQLKNKKEHPN